MSSEKNQTLLFTTETKGMNFGLFICKRFVEAYQGENSVESTVEKGTSFTVKFLTTLKTEQDVKTLLILLKNPYFGKRVRKTGRALEFEILVI